jgi:hypothetical protein
MGIEMSKGIITLLIVTNLATGYQAWVYHQRHQAAISDKTTDREREIYGAACVDWLSEKVTEDDITLALGRSWKKHGQLVFEVIPATDEAWEAARKLTPDGESPTVICTYDKQSGMMYPVLGDERERWMFYE